MGIKVEFTADDLGRDEPTNLAIEHAHGVGVLTAASLMLGQPGTDHAVTVARRNPNLSIGWHLHVCDSVPVTRARWPWGRSPVLAGLALGCWPAARAMVRREIQAQWERFTATGLSCDFVNGHHHLHIHPFIAREMRRTVPLAFSGWVRGFAVESFTPHDEALRNYRRLRKTAQRWLSVWESVRRSDSLWGLDRPFTMQADEIARVLTTLPPGLHEFLFHPRRIGDNDHATLLALRSCRSEKVEPPSR